MPYPGGIAYRISLGETLQERRRRFTLEHYKDGASKITGMKKTQEPEGEENGESTD